MLLNILYKGKQYFCNIPDETPSEAPSPVILLSPGLAENPFHKTIEITPSSITTTSLDEEFIKRALQLVEKNISNAEYTVDNLSKDLGMSRSRLFPKFRSITELTPKNFIRSIRLKRAAQLLQTNQYTVSEIIWMVGFNSVKYFNKYFKEMFGLTPTAYRTDNKNR
jgi:AraC-like DNA-binding protein